jgi:hypothetical protein
LKRAHASVEFVLAYVAQHCFKGNEDVDFFSTQTIPGEWKNCILGKPDRTVDLKIDDVPSLEELQDRIRKSIEFSCAKKKNNPKAKFFTHESGLAWRPTTNDDTFDVEAIYMKAGSEFKDLLEKLLKDTGKTLDQLAGVYPTRRYPDVEEVVRQGFAGAKLQGMKSLDLLLDDGSIGGTVIAMHNEGFLSPEWIAAYLVDTDQNHFMVDERAQIKNNKERYLRIFSVDHDFENPTWMQFGKTNNVYLYLSQRASAAEESWLKIISYVVNLLIDDINRRLDSVTGSRFQLEQMFFDVGVESLADPSSGAFARHQDGFPGLIDALVRGFSRINLIVPTFSIQNHFAETTKIAWYKAGDLKGKEVGSFKHDFFIFHWQLLGVNANFEHEVSLTDINNVYSSPRSSLTVANCFC